MKKIVAILLVVASLFTLSSSVLWCGAEENSKTPEVESTSALNAIIEKEITREEKIEKFLSEKKNYFPDDKLVEIRDILLGLNDNELKMALRLNFDNPSLMRLTIDSGLDRFKLGDTKTGVLTLLLNMTTVALAGLKYVGNVNFGFIANTLLGATAVCAGSLNLYNSFTVRNRIRQANYEYFLNIVNQK